MVGPVSTVHGIENVPNGSAQSIVAMLIECFHRGNLAPCYLFYGQDLALQGQAAVDLAAAVLAKSAQNICGLDLCHTKKYINDGTHPNFMLIEQKESEIVIDDARRLNVFLQSTPTLPGWRFVIINKANMMNSSASNSILKIMEELPKNTVIVMVASSIYQIKKTILSRAQKIFFSRPRHYQQAAAPLDDAVYARLQENVARAMMLHRIPDKTFLDLMAGNDNTEKFLAAVLETLHGAAVSHFGVNSAGCHIDFGNLYEIARKYSAVADFINCSNGRSLSQLHVVTAIFCILAS
jgi:hypothetical protein